jgi:hypothetical protein
MKRTITLYHDPTPTPLLASRVFPTCRHRYATVQDGREWREAGERLLQMLRLGNLKLPSINTFRFDDRSATLGVLFLG